MKTTFLSLIAFLLLTANLSAQKTFEGKITFKMQFEGSMAEQMAAFAPTGMVYQTIGDDTRFEMQGGMAAMMGTFVVRSKEKVMYVIKDSEKKTYKIAIDEQSEAKTEKPKVTKEEEVEEILGYKCQKYKVEMTAQGQQITQYVWAAEDIKIAKPKGNVSAAGGNLHIEGVEGFPLKTVATMTMMGMEITTTTLATEVDKTKLNKSIFESPKGYKVEETTMEKLTTKMMGG